MFDVTTMPLVYVGGCVRDPLLDEFRGLPPRRPHDIDLIAVDAKSTDDIEAFVLEQGGRIYQTKYGVVRAHVPEVGDVDICPPRNDGPTEDGRRPLFITLGTLDDDLARRDFTVNALARTMDGTIIDNHNGVEHLRQGMLHFVGDPEERLAEDALRAFRALRFMVTKQFRCGIATLDAIRKVNPKNFPASVSTERIADELLKAARVDWLRTIRLLTTDFPGLFEIVDRRKVIWFKPTMERP